MLDFVAIWLAYATELVLGTAVVSLTIGVSYQED